MWTLAFGHSNSNQPEHCFSFPFERGPLYELSSRYRVPRRTPATGKETVLSLAESQPQKSEASSDNERDPARPHRYRPVADHDGPLHKNPHKMEQPTKAKIIPATRENVFSSMSYDRARCTEIAIKRSRSRLLAAFSCTKRPPDSRGPDGLGLPMRQRGIVGRPVAIMADSALTATV
jgi:hypothetical protein